MHVPSQATRPDPAGDWLQEANRDFFQQPREPIAPATLKRALVGLLVVVAGVGIIGYQLLSAG